MMQLWPEQGSPRDGRGSRLSRAPSGLWEREEGTSTQGSGSYCDRASAWDRTGIRSRSAREAPKLSPQTSCLARETVAKKVQDAGGSVGGRGCRQTPRATKRMAARPSSVQRIDILVNNAASTVG